MHVDSRTGRRLKIVRESTAPSATNGTRIAVGKGAVWWNPTYGTIWRLDRTGKVVRAIRVTPRYAFSGDAAPLGIAAGAGGVWTTVTIGP